MTDTRIPRNFGRDSSSNTGRRDTRRDSYRRRESYGETADWYSDSHDERPTNLLPQNVDAEAALLGSILIDPEVLPRAAAWLQSDMFYREAHRQIFDAMLATLRMDRGYDANSAPGDLIQTTDMLQRMELLDDVGGVSYVSSLANHVPTSRNWQRYAEIIETTYIQRRGINAAGKIAALFYSLGDGAIADARTQAQTWLYEALRSRDDRRLRLFGDVLHELVAETEARMDGRTASELLPTGYAELDKHIVGFEPGDLWVVGARPRIGKSSLGQNMLLHMCDHMREQARLYQTVPGTALYVTLEMTAKQQVRRVISSTGQVNGRQLRLGFREGDDVDEAAQHRFYQTVAEADSKYHNQILFAEDNLAVEQLDDIVAEAVLEHNTRVVLVDQLDLFEPSDPRRDDEYTLVSRAVKKLKQIARRHGIVVIALAQLNREADGVRPEIKHLRSSGRSEQDADGVLLIHRPFENDPNGSESPRYPNYAEVWIAKMRGNMANLMVPLCWTGSLTTFDNWPPEWPVPVLTAEAEGKGGKTVPPSKRPGAVGPSNSSPSHASQPSYSQGSYTTDDDDN